MSKKGKKSKSERKEWAGAAISPAADTVMPPPSDAPGAALEANPGAALEANPGAALEANPGAALEANPDPDLDGEIEEDLAPIGPTEYLGRGSGSRSRGEVSADTNVVDSERTPPTSREVPPAALEGASVEAVEEQIRELEARLDKMIRQRGVPPPPPSSSGGQGPPPPERPARRLPEEPTSVFETARELLSTDYYLRQWGRMGMRNRSEEVDEFGLDPKYEARFQPLFDFLHRVYFRVEAEGTHHIPAEGRCLVVSNHSGGPLPFDGMMLRAAVKREHPSQRELRWLAEDFIYYLPFVGAMMNRIGAVRACQENAERLLAGGKAVAVFPEGAKGIGKLYRDRYKLQRFGRGGFIRLCLRTQTPIVPCAVVGAEEANPLLYRVEYMTKALGLPYLPVTPTFPALGPLGLLPAPTKWRIRFGEPMPFDGYGPESADDEILVGRLAERVRATIQTMLDRTLAERESIWFG